LFEGLEPIRNLIGEIAQVLADICEHVFPRYPIELNAAAGGKMGEIHLHLSLNVKTALREQGLQLAVDSIAPMRLAYEVQHSEAIFLGRVAEASTKLLQKNCQAFSGPQKEDCVDVGNVQAFAEHVPCEQESDSSGTKLIEQFGPLVSFGFPNNHRRGYASLIELLSHELGVSNGDAESNATDAIQIGLITV
jgi:hypothetical protein